MSTVVTLACKLERMAASRTLQIAGEADLHALASAICAAFDFDFDHAFGFYSETKSRHYSRSNPKFEQFADSGQGSAGALPARGSTVLDAFPKEGRKMLYLFDYGDEWRFIVTRDKDAALAAGAKLPRIVASRGAAPEQYPDPEDE